LTGGASTDTAQYAVVGSVIALTGQVASSTGSVNIREKNIDVLLGIEQLNFAETTYTGTGNTANQLRSAINTTALANNSISEFVGSYDAASRFFTFGASPSNNATLVAFDSNSGNGVNYEIFLLLDKTSVSGAINTSAGTVGVSGL
jgi:hypothetical protein